MNQIIPIGKHEFSGCLKQTVNARELHGFLGVQSRFNDWIIRRIEEYGFIENQDFVGFTQNLVKPQGGRPATEGSTGKCPRRPMAGCSSLTKSNR